MGAHRRRHHRGDRQDHGRRGARLDQRRHRRHVLGPARGNAGVGPPRAHRGQRRGAVRRTARAGRAPGRDEGGRTPRGQGADVTVGARTDGRPGGRTRGRRSFQGRAAGFPYAAAGGEGGTTHLSEHQVQRPRSSNSAFPVVEILRWVCAGGGRETWDERGDGRTDGGKGRGKARNGREGRF